MLHALLFIGACALITAAGAPGRPVQRQHAPGSDASAHGVFYAAQLPLPPHHRHLQASGSYAPSATYAPSTPPSPSFAPTYIPAASTSYLPSASPAATPLPTPAAATLSPSPAASPGAPGTAAAAAAGLLGLTPAAFTLLVIAILVAAAVILGLGCIVMVLWRKVTLLDARVRGARGASEQNNPLLLAAHGAGPEGQRYPPSAPPQGSFSPR